MAWLKTLDHENKTLPLAIGAEVLSTVDSRLRLDECLQQLHVVTPEGQIVAEEVAEVYPGLVQLYKAGEPQSVLYHVLPVMLLNEIQKQYQQIEAQEKVIQSQQEQLKAQEERLKKLEAILLSKGN